MRLYLVLFLLSLSCAHRKEPGAIIYKICKKTDCHVPKSEQSSEKVEVKFFEDRMSVRTTHYQSCNCKKRRLYEKTFSGNYQIFKDIPGPHKRKEIDFKFNSVKTKFYTQDIADMQRANKTCGRKRWTVNVEYDLTNCYAEAFKPLYCNYESSPIDRTCYSMIHLGKKRLRFGTYSVANKVPYSGFYLQKRHVTMSPYKLFKGRHK